MEEINKVDKILDYHEIKGDETLHPYE